MANVDVEFLNELNGYKVIINKETMIEKETGNLLIEKVYDELGDSDLVECNEINPSTDSWLINDGNIYELTKKNVSELKESGSTIISFYGKLEDNIDLDCESDKAFIMWYYGSDTIEEAKKEMLIHN